MKKLFLFVAAVCFSFSMALLLSACGETEQYKIEINQIATETEFFDVVLKDGNKNLVSENNTYMVDAESNIKVEIYAKKNGVSFDDLAIKVGNINKAIIKNNKYSLVPNQGELYYGYFSLANINADLRLTLSGVKQATSTFNFVIDDIEDKTVVEKLKLTQISLDNSEDNFVNFYDYLSGEGEKKFTRTFDGEDNYNEFKTLKVKFDGVIPFDLNTSYPFSISAEEETIKSVEKMERVEDSFVVDLGQVGDKKNYTINVDYKNLKYQDFSIALPKDNLTYSASVDASKTNYSQERIITIQKLQDSSKVDYSEMKVYANELLLDKVEDSETETEVKFILPKGITPASVGGRDKFEIKVEGINYTAETYTMTVKTDVNLLNTQWILPQYFYIDENNELQDVAGVNSDGSAISIEGDTNCLKWGYVYDGGYSCNYDLYNYDVFCGETKLFNLQELLTYHTEDFEEDILEGEFKLKAFFNAESKCFDNFQLEFVSNKDLELSFKNFVEFEKRVQIGYTFDDRRVLGLEVGVENYAQTEELQTVFIEKNNTAEFTVKGGQILVIRIATGNETVGLYEFRLNNSKFSHAWEDGKQFINEDGQRFTECRFVVSDFQFNEIVDIQLVPAVIV